MWAAAQRHPAAVQLLVDRGADVSAVSNPAWMDRPISYAKAVDPRPSQGSGTQQRRQSDRSPEHAGSARRGAHAAGVRGSRERSGIGADSARGRRRREPGDELRVEPAARRDAESVSTSSRHFCSTSGADPNLANKGAWTPLYIAVDNRNIEGGDYPLRKADMDTLEFIKKLIDKGANVNWRVRESTWFRTVFTSQWVLEDGATAFWRAAQSSDLAVMKLLLEHGADPNIATTIDVTPLQVAAGIGWVEGVTYEWSKEANVEAVKLLLSLGNDPNAQAETGRAALHGAGHKGRTESSRCWWTPAPGSTSGTTA